MLYAYRDAADSPVPVKMMFEAVGRRAFTEAIGAYTDWIRTPMRAEKRRQDCSVSCGGQR